MTREQIDSLVEAAMGADGGCIHCVGPILQTYSRVFPDVDWASAIRRFRETTHRTYSADEYIEAMEAE